MHLVAIEGLADVVTGTPLERLDGSRDRSAQILASQFHKRPDTTRVVLEGIVIDDYFFGVSAVSGAGTTLNQGLTFKLNTNYCNRGQLERAFVFVDFGDRFRVLIYCKIPGMD